MRRISCSILVLSILAVFSVTVRSAQAEETVLPESAPSIPEAVEIDAPGSADAQEAGTEAKAARPGDDGAEEEQPVAAMARSVPSDGSENGERLPGLDSMGKVQAASEYAGSAGELKYKIDIDIPSFRDLEPKVGLIYNSQVLGKSGTESVMGPGWSLKGFSSIERVSALAAA